MKERPPIIVVLGHVDHGKTTLLDYIRKTNIAEKEAGGITQSVGAYEITYQNKKLTFIDTPGHEAFSKIRENGTKIADLAILIVAADDGVMPQTKESIEILKNSQTPFIVAINKIDKAPENLEKVKQQLAENGVFLEGYGGNISWQAISAKTGQNINELLDLILLMAELENLKFDENAKAEGFIITAKKDLKKGNIVSVILTNGTLKKNQFIETETAYGKIKILENFLGEKKEILYPSSPAIIYGFEILPHIGEKFSAQEYNDKLVKNKKQQLNEKNKKNINFLKEKNYSKKNEIKIILRADEKNSLNALEKIIENLIKQDYPLKIINSDIGFIHEEETKIAETFNALIVGFKVKTDKTAENLAKIHNIKIITSEIIYELEKQIKELFQKDKEEIIGELEVLAFFNKKDKFQIIGGKIIKGKIFNKSEFEILKNNEKIGTGKIINLQSNKKDVLEAVQGQEVGLLVEADVLIEQNNILIFKNKK